MKCVWQILIAILFIVSCTKQTATSSGDISITDYGGRVVTLEMHASRVVVMASNSLCVLTALDALSYVVALDAKTHSLLPLSIASQLRPDLGGLPNVGKASAANYEVIMAAKPDLILLSSNARDADVMEYKTGVKTAVVKSLDGYDFDIYRKVARLVGKEERADEVIAAIVQYKDKLNGLLSSVDNRKSAYIVLQSADGSLCKTMRSNQSLEAAYITNCAASGGKADEWGIVQYSKEALLSLSPDIIFLDKPLTESSIAVQTLLHDETFSLLDAVKQGSIYLMHSFFLPKDYVYVIAQAYYFASIAYPELVTREVYHDAINDMFSLVYHAEDYFDTFDAEYR